MQRNHSQNESSSSLLWGFHTGTAHKQHDRVAKVHSQATLSLLSLYSLDSMDTKRERTKLFFNCFIFFCVKFILRIIHATQTYAIVLYNNVFFLFSCIFGQISAKLYNHGAAYSHWCHKVIYPLIILQFSMSMIYSDANKWWKDIRIQPHETKVAI